MELRHLRYFLKIAETLSFTRAAATLRVTQPTLSHQLKQLESEIGAPLFDRIGRGIRLTEQGRVFRRHAERALTEIETGLTELSELQGLLRGKLSIGVFRSFGNSPLPVVLADFHRAHGGIRIAAAQMSLSDMERGLIDGLLDLAVTTYVPPASERILSEEIFTEPLVLVIGAQHPLCRHARIGLEELSDTPLVLRPAMTPSRQLIERCFRARAVAPRVAMEMNSTEATLATVRCSELATICAARAVEGVAGLQTVRIAEPALRRTGAILWHRDRYRSTAANTLAQMIKRAYAPQGAKPARRKARRMKASGTG